MSKVLYLLAPTKTREHCLAKPPILQHFTTMLVNIDKSVQESPEEDESESPTEHARSPNIPGREEVFLPGEISFAYEKYRHEEGGKYVKDKAMSTVQSQDTRYAT